MSEKKIRYAVVGLGDIAQEAVLPAFKNSKNAKLSALVSGDEEKLRVLGKKYGISNLFKYEQYEDCLNSGLIDAVFIALPNNMHKDYTVRAAHAGIHVLCEKPMAVSSSECMEMIQACETYQVKLMVAYRLHFEQGNLSAIDLAQSKKELGELRMFQSIHSQAVRHPNIRTSPVSEGGGPVFDMGIYDINAARYLFRDEPVSVFAWAASLNREEFKDSEEMMSIILKFPDERLSSILVSFGTVDTDTFRLVGSRGELSLDPAYTYVGEKRLRISVAGKSREIKIPAHDHFGAEIDYFSDCIVNHRRVEPSGWEGLADIRIIEAIYESARTGEVVKLDPFQRIDRPSLSQEVDRPPLEKQEVFHAESPSKKQAA
jgi:glucose-fructose oxidoreductase